MRSRRCCVRSLASPPLLRAREAVLTETRAACATSLSVTLIGTAVKLETIAKRYGHNKPVSSLKNGSALLNLASFLETFPEQVPPWIKTEFNFMKAFRGTYTVMITPFAGSGEVDVPALRAFVDWQIEQGIHGLIPLGSTGEFLSLDDDEKALVAETVITQAAGRVPVLIGTGAEDTREVVRLSRRAERLGADGVM